MSLNYLKVYLLWFSVERNLVYVVFFKNTSMLSEIVLENPYQIFFY